MSKRKKRGWRPRLHVEVEQRSVAIVAPTMDLCHTAWATSLANMCMHTMMHGPSIGLVLWTYGSSVLPFSRQHLAKLAVDTGITHTLWIDSDMSFPPDTLLRFLKRSEPIIGINAMTRREPFRSTAQSSPGENIPTNRDSTGLEKVERMGFGMVWVATDVFRAVEKPWFEHEWIPEQEIFRGEDYYFFNKVRDAGFECYVDHDLSKEVGHIGSFTFNPTMLEAKEAAR